MGRNIGDFVFGGNLDVRAAKALDSRTVVEKLSDLTNPEAWKSGNNSTYTYEGLVVAVVEDQSLWMLVDNTKISSSEGWKRLDADASVVDEIADSIDAIDSSINEIKESIEKLDTDLSELAETVTTEIKDSLSTVYKYQGSCLYAELESKTPEVGDVWNVTDAHDNIPAGTNYAWDGINWDALGGSVDLSIYATNEDLDELTENVSNIETEIKTDLSDVSARLGTLSDTVDTNTTNIDALSKSIAVTDSSVGKLTSQLNDLAGFDFGKLDSISGIVEEVSSLKASVGDETSGLVKAVADINTDVASLQDVIGDSNSGLVKVVADIQKDYALKSELETVSTAVTKNTNDIATLNEALTWHEYSA